MGVYLVWPVFYNDLNDSYRLSRRGRLRADLGGVYFNVIFIVVLAGAFGLTGFRPLVLLIAVQHLAILQQFLPFLRLDGYYLVSDVAGVPDLFGRIKPIMESLVPGRRRLPAVTQLKPKARVFVTAWVLVTVPLLGAFFLLLALRLPRFVATASDAVAVQARTLVAAVGSGAPLVAVASGLGIALLVIPCAGVAITLLRVLGRGSRAARRRRGGASAPVH